MRQLLLSLCLVSALQLKAAPTPDSSRNAPRSSISLHLGTTGPRLYYSHLLNQHHRLWGRVGAQYVARTRPFQVKVDQDAYVTVTPDFMIGLAEAGLKWYPFRRGTFFITAGAAYNWHPHLNLAITSQTEINLGGLLLTPRDVGTIDLRFRWPSVMGYVGGGFGRTVPRKRLGVGVEIGMLYLGKPRVSLNYDGFLEATTIDEQVPVVEHNLSGYRYLPSVNVTLTYGLGRVK